MGLIELFILAVGLSMDAFAVSVCKGLSLWEDQDETYVHCRCMVWRISGSDASDWLFCRTLSK